MRHYLLFSIVILLATLPISCGSTLTKCQIVQEWTIKNYKIKKSKCEDLVQAFYYVHDVYLGDKKLPRSATRVDSCKFTWQEESERFLTFNICDNIIHEIKPKKIFLNAPAIDSVTIFSNELGQTQLLTRKQIEKFIRDWNKSSNRGYSDKPFDKAFNYFPAYQYKLVVFSKGSERPFYGYNYLILDSSCWEYEMGKSGDLGYFHNYWRK